MNSKFQNLHRGKEIKQQIITQKLIKFTTTKIRTRSDLVQEKAHQHN